MRKKTKLEKKFQRLVALESTQTTQDLRDIDMLTPEEEQVFHIIQQQIALPTGKHKMTFEEYVNTMGKKGVVDAYIEPDMISGVPRLAHVISSTFVLLLLLTTQNIIYMVVAGICIYALLLVYYLQNRPQLRKTNINQILAEGIKD
ncbi:MAG: hypothetical protein SFT92_00475 [Rickettsiales bacterium]|nr:hypothetical protein [Rickettsiales bacterium]